MKRVKKAAKQIENLLREHPEYEEDVYADMLALRNDLIGAIEAGGDPVASANSCDPEDPQCDPGQDPGDPGPPPDP